MAIQLSTDTVRSFKNFEAKVLDVLPEIGKRQILTYISQMKKEGVVDKEAFAKAVDKWLNKDAKTPEVQKVLKEKSSELLYEAASPHHGDRKDGYNVLMAAFRAGVSPEAKALRESITNPGASTPTSSNKPRA
jgi:hypothetical protein